MASCSFTCIVVQNFSCESYCCYQFLHGLFSLGCQFPFEYCFIKRATLYVMLIISRQMYTNSQNKLLQKFQGIQYFSFKFLLGPSQLSRDALLFPFTPPKGDLAMYPKAVPLSYLLQTSQARKGPSSRQCIPSQLNKGHQNVCPSKKYRLVYLLC